MLDPAKYREWAKAFSSESQFQGEWEEGRHMTFTDPRFGGTKALLEEVTPYERIHAKHVAIIKKDGSEDTESESARKWLGITETYEFVEKDGATELTVEMRTHSDYISMFNDCWPNALKLLKEICET